MLTRNKSYEELWSGKHRMETRVLIAGHYLYDDDMIEPVTTIQSLYGNDFGIGNCASSQIKFTIWEPDWNIPRMATITLETRLRNEINVGEWMPQGTFLLDSRTIDESYREDGCVKMEIVGYDRMMLTEGDCPDTISFPAKDIDIVKMIANSIDVSVDADTTKLINAGHRFKSVEYYSGREILGYIAGMYGGNFIISKTNTLRFVPLGSAPPDTYYLINEIGDIILIGGDRIVLR